MKLGLYTWILIVIATACSSKQQKEEKHIITSETGSAATTTNSSDSTVQTLNEQVDTTWLMSERLPIWFVKENILSQKQISKHYEVDMLLNPFYLEEDFNGDGVMDIALHIRHVKSNKVGFAIIHGNSFDIHIAGAGTMIKNGLSDHMNYISIWRINRKTENEPGVEENTGNGKDGILLLNNPSIEIEASEIGGGLIYWNGKEYAYFHQTC